MPISSQFRYPPAPNDFTSRLPRVNANADPGMVAQPYVDPGFGLHNTPVGNLNQSPGQTVSGYLPASLPVTPPPVTPPPVAPPQANLPPAPPLTTIVTPKGVRFTVASQYAPQFQGLTTDLENAGYPINSNTSGGYNRRVIGGTNTPSEHAFGRAIDVNWDENPHGSTRFSIPPDIARGLAKKYNMTWGGDWQGPTQDAMHFQVAAPGPGPGPAPIMTASSGGTPDRTGAPIDTGPAAAAPQGAPGTNTADVDLGSVFQAHLKQLQAQQAALTAQGVTRPNPMGFGLSLPAGNSVVASLNQAAQAFKGVA